MHSSIQSVESNLDAPYYPKVDLHSDSIIRRHQWHLLTGTLLVNDFFMLGVAFLLAYFVRFYSDLPLFRLDIQPVYDFYRNLSFLLNPLWAAIFLTFGLYKRKNLLGGTTEYSLAFRATSVGIMLVVLISFLNPGFVLARGWLLVAWVLSFTLVVFGRFIIRRFVYILRKRGFFLSPAIIVGANEEGHSLAQQLLAWRTSGLHVVGFVDDNVETGAKVHAHLKNLGHTDYLDEFIKSYQVEEIVIATSALTRDEMLPIFKKYGLRDGLNLRLSSGLFEIITTGLEVKEMACTPLVRVQNVRLTGFDRMMKLGLDYMLTVPALLALGPLMLLIGLLVKFDSAGPVIYKRRVMGVNGHKFDAYKFRTMRIDGDQILEQNPELKAELARNHKLKDDPRITGVGKFLRKSSLDELPQLFNVLKREMSLVGPRMIAPSEMDMYDEWGLNLLTVLPGISGLWQVSGRSDISYDERVRLDMYYIRNWSIWLDLQIILQTIPAMIKGRGAY